MESKEKTADVITACSLDSPELSKRKAALQKNIFSKAEEVTESEGSLRFVFRTSDEFSSRLIDFINLERKCCPFFWFKVDFMPEQGPIQVEIGGPKEAEEILRNLIKE